MPTETPAITFPKMLDYFKDKGIGALGIGSFGPLCLNPGDPHFGAIGATPKLPWRGFDLMGEFARGLGVPVALDTDVNAAALAEAQLGAAKGLGSCLYVTIGTGVGGGVIVDGKPIHGLMHPELGHQLICPHPEDPSPEGFCPYHKGCLEGLASGPALEKRWSISSRNLPASHIGWTIEADYLAQMCHNAIMSFSPEKIILGGGVMQQDFLFPMIRAKTIEYLGGYISSESVNHGLEDYIVAPGLGINSGLFGSYLLAKKAK